MSTAVHRLQMCLVRVLKISLVRWPEGALDIITERTSGGTHKKVRVGNYDGFHERNKVPIEANAVKWAPGLV